MAVQREELLWSFLSAVGWQPAREKGADIGGPHLEQVG
jgi:hypothetical protein